jgi:hypothetical protein
MRLLEALAATLVLIGTILLLLAMASVLVRAQRIMDHPTGHTIYERWQRPGGGMSCCSGKDCGPWDETDVQPTRDGFWLRSLHTHVPMASVLPSPDGQFHVCCRREAADVECERNEDGTASVFCLAAPMGY